MGRQGYFTTASKQAGRNLAPTSHCKSMDAELPLPQYAPSCLQFVAIAHVM